MLFSYYAQAYIKQYPGRGFEELPIPCQHTLLAEWIDDHRADFCTHVSSSHVAQLFCQLLASTDLAQTALACKQQIIDEAMKPSAAGWEEGYAWSVADAYKTIRDEFAEKAKQRTTLKIITLIKRQLNHGILL